MTSEKDTVIWHNYLMATIFFSILPDLDVDNVFLKIILLVYRILPPFNEAVPPVSLAGTLWLFNRVYANG